MIKIKKALKISIIGILAVVVILFLLSIGRIYEWNELQYGVTFSKRQAESLGLDWKKVYSDMFTDLRVKKIRLSAYWNEVEEKNNSYYWDDIDWQVKTAEENGAEIVLAVGGRLPRWPECHWPDWSLDISEEERKKEMRAYIETVVLKYKDNKAIYAWQVENEPFLPYFGICPEPDPGFLDEEIALVRSLDSRPIVVTDSGELSLWVGAAKRADIFGTTMYRDTYSKHLERYVHYPIIPAFFRIKKNLVDFFAEPEKWVVIELQAEPWGPIPFQNLSQEDRNRTMDLEKFRDMIRFAQRTGFQEFYLWGVEWWYWEKEKKDNPELWNMAKTLFSNPEAAVK